LEPHRLSDPVDLADPKILATATSKLGLTVQFSNARAYDSLMLARLNELCGELGPSLKVRFFGHYSTGFDASILNSLSQVQSLSVDCLSEISGQSALTELPNLRHLNFGVFNFDQPDFLEGLPLEQLESLGLTENRKRNFDLAPLVRCVRLEHLFVNGHYRNIDRIAANPKLRRIGLSAFPNQHDLAFLSKLPKLRELMLILGGRQNLNEFSSKSLELLKVIRVRGLSDLGSLNRFPALSALQVEDQIQLKYLNLSGVSLERLWISNCKRLEQLAGLDGQSELKEFFCAKVALDLDGLRNREWPSSLAAIILANGKRKWLDETNDFFAAKGKDRNFTPWF
jgi:hypothetical protein